jgi:hypothetical protein
MGLFYNVENKTKRAMESRKIIRPCTLHLQCWGTRATGGVHCNGQCQPPHILKVTDKSCRNDTETNKYFIEKAMNDIFIVDISCTNKMNFMV